MKSTPTEEWRTQPRGKYITETEVETAIHQLTTEQKKPSVRNIRAILERGSNHTINEYRKKVLSKIDNAIDNKTPTLYNESSNLDNGLDNELDNRKDNELEQIKTRLTQIENSQQEKTTNPLTETVTALQNEIQRLITEHDKDNTKIKDLNLTHTIYQEKLNEYHIVLKSVCEGYEQVLKEMKPLKNTHHNTNEKAKARFLEIRKEHPAYSLSQIVALLTGENILNTKGKPFDASVLSRWQRMK